MILAPVSSVAVPRACSVVTIFVSLRETSWWCVKLRVPASSASIPKSSVDGSNTRKNNSQSHSVGSSELYTELIKSVMSNVLRGKCMYRGCGCYMMCERSENGMCKCGHADAWHVNYGDMRVLGQIPAIGAMYTHMKELVDKLETPTREWQKEVEARAQCVICMDDISSVVLLPCRHANVCVTCSSHLVAHEFPKCPTCRAPIRRRVRYINTNTT